MVPVGTAAVLGAAAFCLIATATPAQPELWKYEWPRTNFSISLVDHSEIMSGGPPRDGIPAISNPQFHAVAEEAQLSLREPVMTLELEGETPRAYPVRYLLWHEIINDTVGDLPIAVTYCPLCNSGIVFDRRTSRGDTLTFGVTGKLRLSDMVMYDRETESWWQQAVGQGIIGEYAGEELQSLPAWTESWGEFSERNPDGLVMSEPRFNRRYGTNPYLRYDSAERPFLYFGDNPPFGIHPLARVVRVGERAWPLERLRELETLTEGGLEFSWTAGQASPLDQSQVADGRDVGTIRVKEEASKRDVAHDLLFAFAFHAFYPEGQWMLGD